MDSNRFDALARTIASRPSRRQTVGWLLGALVGGRVGLSLAQERTAVSGNGGLAGAGADGGAVLTGDVNSGGNTGNAISVRDSAGEVEVQGGAVSNTTGIGIEASGGTAITDASGGDNNVAGIIESGPDADDDDDDDEDDLDDDELDADEIEDEDEEFDPDDSEPAEPNVPEPEFPESTLEPEPEPGPESTPEPTPPPVPTPTPTPGPLPTPAPTATPSSTPSATPTPTPTPESTCPCSGANPYYCGGTPSGCCHFDRCGINQQSGAYCCNCGTGECECVPAICVGV